MSLGFIGWLAGFFISLALYFAYISDITQYLSSSVWLISLSIMPLSSMHTITNAQMAGLHSFLWLVFHCMYTNSVCVCVCVCVCVSTDHKPSWPNYLPNAPPLDTTILEVRTSTQRFWGDTLIPEHGAKGGNSKFKCWNLWSHIIGIELHMGLEIYRELTFLNASKICIAKWTTLKFTIQ